MSHFGGYGRVTSSMMVRKLQRDIKKRNEREFKEARARITGIRVEKPSDDPHAWMKAAECRSEKRKFTLEKESISEFLPVLKSAEDTLSHISNALVTVLEVCDQAQGADVAPPKFLSFREHVRAAKENIPIYLNTKTSFGGYLFGGGGFAQPFNVVAAGAVNGNIPCLEYHSVPLITIQNVDVGTADALQAKTNQMETRKITLLHQDVDVAIRGAEICGVGVFNFRGDDGQETSISGDCYAVVSKIEELLTQLINNSGDAQQHLADLGRCMERVKHVRGMNVEISSLRVRLLKERLGSIKSSLDLQIDLLNERIHDLIYY